MINKSTKSLLGDHSLGWMKLSSKISGVNAPIQLGDHILQELPPKTINHIEYAQHHERIVSFEDDNDFQYMMKTYSSGLLLGAHYAPFLYGITIDPHNTDLNHIPHKLGFQLSFPDFAIRSIKLADNLHSVSNIDEFQSFYDAVNIRSSCSVLMRFDDIGKYVDKDRIHTKINKLLNDPNELERMKTIFGSSLFIRIPVEESYVESQEIPEFLVSGRKNKRMIQLLTFHKHPILERFVSRQITHIQHMHPGKLPAVGVTSANVSSTPEIIDEKMMRHFWSRGYRSKLMPVIYWNKTKIADSHSRTGSFPILEVGEKTDTLKLVRAGNLPPNITSELVKKVGLKVKISKDMKPHSYRYSPINYDTQEIPLIG